MIILDKLSDLISKHQCNIVKDKESFKVAFFLYLLLIPTSSFHFGIQTGFLLEHHTRVRNRMAL